MSRVGWIRVLTLIWLKELYCIETEMINNTCFLGGWWATDKHFIPRAPCHKTFWIPFWHFSRWIEVRTRKHNTYFFIWRISKTKEKLTAQEQTPTADPGGQRLERSPRGQLWDQDLRLDFSKVFRKTITEGDSSEIKIFTLILAKFSKDNSSRGQLPDQDMI